MTTYLRPTAPVAADALLVGDPKRAMDLAALLMEKPRMSNLSRGLWGYHGVTRDGHELTVQSTGIGGASAAAVVCDLAALGVTCAIRVGTCVAIEPRLEPGRSLVVDGVIAADGVGSRLAGEGSLKPDRALTAALVEATSAEPGRVASTDPPARNGMRAEWLRAGAVAVDLSAAAVLAVGANLGLRCGCALVVAEASDGAGLSDEALDSEALGLGKGAAAALASGQGHG